MPNLSISQSIRDLRYSVIREMSGLAVGMEDVINLGIGEPDFTTPEPIILKACADARKGHTHYTPSQGDPELIEKLAAVISVSQGRAVTPAQILVTHGGMGALTAALRTLLEQGDEVLLIEPHFPDYMAHIAFAGGRAVKIASRFEENFIPRPEQIEAAITTKTKVIILNSPNNPTGAVLPASILDAIADIAMRNNLFVISDEVYDQILFEPPFESISSRPGMAERTLVIKSFSKNYAMTGWRVGYCYGPLTLMEQMLKVVNYSTACASSVGQRAALAALDIDPAIILGMRDRFAARAELVCTRMNAMRGVKVLRPKGSFYIFADVREITRQSRKFALDLLYTNRVVVIPGYAFGESGEGCIRIACTRSREVLDEAMNRIASFLHGYKET